MSADKARTSLWIYSGLMGLSLASVFLVYTAASITRTFFITSATFAGMSLYGYTTKKDLSEIGSFMIMGLIGISIASLVNIFLKSSNVDFVISILGVVIFTVLTAYDAQRIKDMYSGYIDDDSRGKIAILGALSLYMDFINLFVMLLRFFGETRRD